MARPSLLRGFRRGPSEQTADRAAPRGDRRRGVPAGELRRERRQLLHERELRLRDLGGVVLEMYRQDNFRESLLYDLAAEVGAIDDRIRELDLLLEARRPPAARCDCGAPLFRDARFCASYGRALDWHAGVTAGG